MSHINRQSQGKFSNIQQFTQAVLGNVCIKKPVNEIKFVNKQTKNNSRIVQYTVLKSEPVKEFINDPKAFINKRMKHEEPELYMYDDDVSNCVGILNEFMGLSNRFGKNIHCSQDYIAKRLGLCRATVNRWIKKLAEWGLITKVYRSQGGVYLSCLYGISSYFLNETVRQSLKGIFYALSYMHIAMITPSIQATNQYNSKKCYSISFNCLKNINNLAIDTKIPSKNTYEGETISQAYGGTPLHKRQIVKVLHVTAQDKLLDIYPHLSSYFAVAIAIKLHLTPSRSAWLSQVPNQILRDTYTQLFNDMKYGKKINKERCYLAGIIHKLCKAQDVIVNYNLVPATIAMYDLDSSWVKLLPEELSILSNKIRPLQDKLYIAFDELYKKNPEKQKRREDAEKRKAEETVLRGRTNPYSRYYTGDPFVNTSSLSKSSVTKPSNAKQGISLSNPPSVPQVSPKSPKETIISNNPPALAPESQCKLDIENYRKSLSNMSPFLDPVRMRNNWNNELKFKFPFLPSDFDILTYQF